MNATLVTTMPPGDFAYVSALSTGWYPQLHSLIHRHRPVTFDHWPLRQLPDDVLSQVTRQGYQHLTLQNDRWQHFFVPPAGGVNPPAPDGVPANGGAA